MRKRTLKQRFFLYLGKRPVPINMRPLRWQKTAFQEAFQLIFKANLIVGHGPPMGRIQREPYGRRWQSSHPASKLVRSVRQIAAEQFVGTFATKSDGCFPLAHFRKKPNRERSCISIRLVGVIATFLNCSL